MVLNYVVAGVWLAVLVVGVVGAVVLGWAFWEKNAIDATLAQLEEDIAAAHAGPHPTEEQVAALNQRIDAVQKRFDRFSLSLFVVPRGK